MRTAITRRNVKGEADSQQETYTTLPPYPTHRKWITQYTERYETEIQIAKPKFATSYNRLTIMHVHTLTDKLNNWQTTFQERTGPAIAQEHLHYKTLKTASKPANVSTVHMIALQMDLNIQEIFWNVS